MVKHNEILTAKMNAEGEILTVTSGEYPPKIIAFLLATLTQAAAKSIIKETGKGNIEQLETEISNSYIEYLKLATPMRDLN